MSVHASNRWRNAIYLVMASVALAIFAGGASPLLTRNVEILDMIGLWGVVAGAIPFLIMRTGMFYSLAKSSVDRESILARRHSRLGVLLLASTTAIVAAMVWRALVVGLPGWKTAFLLFYGLFLFHAAGWSIRGPKFLRRDHR